ITLIVIFVSSVAACSSPDVGQSQYASYESCPQSSTLSQGIDVSGYQPNTDWTQASTALDWAIIKASDGVTYTNPYFAQDWARTRSSGGGWGAPREWGMRRGVFCCSCPAEAPAQGADSCVDSVNRSGGCESGDRAALDLECPPDAVCAPAATVAANALTWLGE